MRIFANLLLSVAACTLLALTVISEAACAPVPAPKPKQKEKTLPNHFVGGWRMQWGGGTGDVIFAADRADAKIGSYWCMWCDRQWIGTWRAEGNKLHVTEGEVPDRPDSVIGPPLTWHVNLDATRLAGECVLENSTMVFRLIPHGKEFENE